MAQQLVNIGGNPNDVNHRYKRERIDLEHINRKGGMRRIRNLRRIIGQLSQTAVNVDAFEQEFYDRVKRNGLRVDSEGWFKGDITDRKLEDILNGMIKEIILCPKCGLPEWDFQYCRSCGHIKKKKHKKSKTDTEPDAEERPPQTHLADAVMVMGKMYDLYATRDTRVDEKDPINWKHMEQCMDKFWEIDNDNESRHQEFASRMRILFPL